MKRIQAEIEFMENIMHRALDSEEEKFLRKVGQKIISEHSRLMDKESVSISKHFWGKYLSIM